MDSIIEQQRQTHEEVDRLERTLAGLLAQTGNTVSGTVRVRGSLDQSCRMQHDQNLANEHRAKDILGRITDRVSNLTQTYADADE